MSQIKIYKTEITPDRNAKVDQIQDYLNSCVVSYHTDKLQYQKIALDMSIKLPIPQENRFQLGNYVCINQDNKDWYFFIMGSQWTSKKAVSLFLSLDTINTFPELTFSDRTQIFREHKDRLFSYGDGVNFLRNIWPISEDITVPLLSDGKEITIVDSTLPDVDWFLLYKTRDDLTPTNTANPVECDLFASIPLLIKKGRQDLPSQVYTTPSFMESGKYYYIDPVNNPGAQVIFGDPKHGVSTLKDTEIWRFWSANNKIYQNTITYQKDDGNSYHYVEDSQAVGWGRVEFVKTNFFTVGPNIKNRSDIIRLSNTKTLATGSQPEVKTTTIDEVDKTDSKIMKIIRLPYAPVEVESNASGEYVFPAEWEFKNGFMRLKPDKLSQELSNEHFAECDIHELKFMSFSKLSPEQKPRASLESKLFHSDYYSFKIVYDSFVKDIPLENIDFTRIDLSSSNPSYVPYLVLDFKPTNTINSKLAFHYWIADPAGENILNWQTADYNDYLLASRNNEETIFSNDFVNYIRNGYNYDKKQHSISMWQQGINMFVQAASAAASFGLVGDGAGLLKASQMATQAAEDLTDSRTGTQIGPYTFRVSPKIAQQDYEDAMWAAKQIKEKAQPIAMAQTISTATSAIQSGVNMIISHLQFQNQMAAKLANLSAQSTTTSGTDDIDLLKYYNKNRLQIIKYRPRWQERDKLFKLFFYYGYKTNEIKQPDTYTRWWFNYLQCDAHFVEEAEPLYADFITDIKTRYQQGITIFHNHNGVYNFAQDKENLEVFLVE